MIAYVTVGTNNFVRAEKFFDKLLSALNIAQVHKTDRMIFWAEDNGGPGFSLVKPYDGEEASIGNGVMVALSADTPAIVEKAYRIAIEQGATCEGPPGRRQAGHYVAYFRDLDGNKFNLFCASPR